MGRKLVIIGDPGIDTAFALALALNDPDLCVLGAIATGGNVEADQATHNMRVIVEQLDPRRWPRIGAALPIPYGMNGSAIHGRGGLGGVEIPVTKRHEPLPGDKVLSELLAESPRELTIVNLGPLSVLALTLEREPHLIEQIERIIAVGGAWRVPGDAGPVSEFHFACDPKAARFVLHCGAPIQLIPLDVSRQIVLSPTDLLELPEPEARTCQFLRRIVPAGIRNTANEHGIEGFHLCDVMGVMAVARPEAVTMTRLAADVEPHGEVARGQLIIDSRPRPSAHAAMIHVATAVDVPAVRMYIKDILASSV